MTDHDNQVPKPGGAFEAKVRRSRRMIFLERLWPRLWAVLAVIATFVIASFAGLWENVAGYLHQGLLAVFGIAFLVAIGFAMRVTSATRDEAVRRIERDSGVPHRPASSYEDTFSSEASGPETQALWQAHKSRLAKMLASLRVGGPHPDMPRHDPWALRALLMLGVVILTAFVGERAGDRLAGAFDVHFETPLSRARVDAWITPPPYTAKPPVMLADGGRSEGSASTAVTETGAINVPEKSVLITRATGVDARDVAIEIQSEGGEPELIRAEAAVTPGAKLSEVVELRRTLETSARMRLLIGGQEAATWTFVVDPDLPPVIAMSKPAEKSRRGSLKLSYSIKDDYGVASARAKIVRAPAEDEDPETAWARTDVLKGPRPPLERPPQLDLRLPRANAKEGEAVSHLEMGAHPWAGMKVIMTLEATDVAGKVGRSEDIAMVLPERQFTKPLARAVVEQRRKLVQDPRYREQVMLALAALTLEPDGFIDDVQVYLGLRTALYRLEREQTRAGRNSVIEQLWHIALRIEDGDLSDAERRMREAQDKLSKLLEDGASDKEIEEAMKELREALNDYMQQLAKQAQENPMQPQQGQDPDNQFMSQQDLERMMREIEEMAKSGAREQAQQMLSEMRDMLDRMQAGQQNQQGQQQSQKMQEMMNELGDMVGQQQKLMDDTFSQQRSEGRPGQENQSGQQGQPGEAGQQSQQRRRGPQQGRGPQGGQQQGQQGQAGQSGQQGQQGQGLSQRQEALRQRLGELQRELGENGAGNPQQLDNARQAMENAERALQEGDLGSATSEQARALDQMRQGAQQMAQEMMQNMPQRYGRNGDTPRDPLGRPQRSEGPDQGASVKVPDQIDMQRAREILEELRRRLGQPLRPNEELDYIERLLRRF